MRSHNKLYFLQVALTSRSFLCRQQDMNVDSTAYRELTEKEDKLQKHILQLSEENIELKFEVEQARKDIPRLKVIKFYSDN